MNRRIGFALLCVFLWVPAAGIVFAQSPSVGVTEGDKATYNCILQGSHDQSLSWEPWMLERNQSTWEVTVTNVADTKVTYQLRILLANGTEETFPSQFVDLYSGGSNGPNYMIFVQANLNAGDSIYPGGTPYVVNDTTTRTYPSGQRTTNHVNFHSPLDYRDVYLDKTTGVMVELTYTYLDLAGTFNLKLIYSSIWVVSPSPTSTPTASSSPSASISPSLTPTASIPEFSSITTLSIIVLAGLIVIAILRKNSVLRT